MSDQNEYWEALYLKRFGQLTAQQWSLPNLKALYANKAQQQQPRRKPVTETDWEQGLRFLIHDSFCDAVAYMWHIPLLPLKAAGLLCYPLHCLLRLRYKFPALHLKEFQHLGPELEVNEASFWWPEPSFVANHPPSVVCAAMKVYRTRGGGVTRARHVHCNWVIDWWRLDAFALKTIWVALQAMVQELALTLTLLNLALFTLGTFGWPVWLRLVGGHAAVSAVLVGLFFPLFVGLQCFLAVLPIWSPSWLLASLGWSALSHGAVALQAA